MIIPEPSLTSRLDIKSIGWQLPSIGVGGPRKRPLPTLGCIKTENYAVGSMARLNNQVSYLYPQFKSFSSPHMQSLLFVKLERGI